MSIKIIFNIIILLIFAINIGFTQGASSIVGGLKFDTDDGKRTSYQMFEQSQTWSNDSLVISFDISFFDNNRIGHLLSCNNNKNELFSLFASPNKERTDLILNLNLTFAQAKLQLPIDIKECRAHKWHHVTLKIYPSNGLASLQVGDTHQEVRFGSVNTSATCNYYFGSFSHYANFIRFAIVNLGYSSDGNEPIFFPLDNAQGDRVYDSHKNVFGIAYNPIWLYSKHCNWELVAQIDCNDQTAIFQDKELSKIVVYSPQNSWIYDLNTSLISQQEHNFDDAFLFYEHGGGDNIVNPTTGDVLIFNNTIKESERDNSVALYNYIDNTLTKIKTNIVQNRLHHSSVFANSDFSKIYQFGGFGYSRYSNKFHCYQPQEQTWNQVRFSGDTILPRYYSSVASSMGDTANVAYIYGGYGNESGQLFDSRKFYYDLYRINIDKQQVELLYEFDLESQNIVPCRDIIMDEGNSCFYTMCYKQYETSTDLALYKFNYKTGDVSAAADKIPFFSQKIQTRISLFNDQATKHLVCAVQEYIDHDSIVIKLYKLNFPPVTDNIINQSTTQVVHNDSNSPIALLVVGVAVVLCVVVVHRRRVKQRGIVAVHDNQEIAPELMAEPAATEPAVEECLADKEQIKAPQSELVQENHIAHPSTIEQAPQVSSPATSVEPTVMLDEPQEDIDTAQPIKHSQNNAIANSIYLIGEFTAIDRNGRDISYMFSSKIRQLFLSVLLYTHRQTYKGITSSELSMLVWPDKEPNKAKNIRGVTIKGLRNILAEIDGIALVYNDNKWFVEIDSALCYCDYLELKNNNIIPADISKVQLSQLSPYIDIISRGRLLHTQEYPWLDTFKSDIEEQIIKDLYPILQHNYNAKSYQTSYKLSQVLLDYDPLNIDVAKIEINSLVKLGDQAKAKIKFYHFALRYNNAYGENISFDQMIE